MFEDYPDLFTRRQAQELLHIGKNRILKYIHSGRLRALVLDGRYLIRKQDIINFLRTFPYA
ncbi:MAG: helix-turn-helix domain-containing protein [Lachnospiraceae bacterium]|nr:helix-turn-helix domain-containing protein [Lachnospiraceae bacterium]